MSIATCCDYSRYRGSHRVLSVGCPPLLFFMVNSTSTLIKYTHITFTLICLSPDQVSGTLIYSSTAVFVLFYINFIPTQKKMFFSIYLPEFKGCNSTHGQRTIYLRLKSVHMHVELVSRN